LHRSAAHERLAGLREEAMSSLDHGNLVVGDDGREKTFMKKRSLLSASGRSWILARRAASVAADRDASAS
jgi:hypothetical protein